MPSATPDTWRMLSTVAEAGSEIERWMMLKRGLHDGKLRFTSTQP